MGPARTATATTVALIRSTVGAAAGAIVLGVGAGALAAPQGEFVVIRDLPVRNALLPGEPGRAVVVHTAPDMSLVSDLFGDTPNNSITPITDHAAAAISAGMSQAEGSLSVSAAQDHDGNAAADQYMLAGASMESSGGLGGAISGAVGTGLAPLMGITQGLGSMLGGRP